MSLSAYAFCQGDRAEIGRSRMLWPDPLPEPSAVNAVPITDHESRRIPPGKRLVNCCATHSAVGCAVTPNQRSCRRACSSIRNPYNSRNEIVGTTNKSIEAMPSA